MSNLGNGSTGTVLIGVGNGSTPTFSATPTVTGMTINGTPSAGTDATNVTYVTNAIAAVNPATSVIAATTGALTVTYNNGVSGVGATLTNAGAQAAFSIDGQSPTIGQRVLIKNQGANAFQNGVYLVTIIGTGITNWVLTRAVDYDQPSDINNTGMINVLNGSVNAGTGWVINSTVTTMGIDSITYTQFTGVTSITITGDSGGGLSGSSFTLTGGTTGLTFAGSGTTETLGGDLVVANGGTGKASFTAYSVVTAGTTSTGVFQNVVGVGTSGQVLTSTGASALPTWQTAPSGVFAPNAVINLFDDFIGFSNQSSGNDSNYAWDASTFGTMSATENGHPGLYTNPSMTNSSFGLILDNVAGSTRYQNIILGGGVITINWIFKIVNLSNSSNRYDLRFGIGDPAVNQTTDFVNGCYFEYSDNINSGNWNFKTASASTRTTSTSSTAVTTGWHNAQLIINAAASSVQFNMDGVSLGTAITTNIPTAAISPCFYMQWIVGTIAATTIIVDLFYMNQILTTPR